MQPNDECCFGRNWVASGKKALRVRRGDIARIECSFARGPGRIHRARKFVVPQSESSRYENFDQTPKNRRHAS